MARKPKHHAGQVKNFVSLSFTAPIDFEEPMNKAAAARQMSRSAYICWLVAQDMDFQQRHPLPQTANALPKIPPRIRRKSKKPPSS